MEIRIKIKPAKVEKVTIKNKAQLAQDLLEITTEHVDQDSDIEVFVP